MSQQWSAQSQTSSRRRGRNNADPYIDLSQMATVDILRSLVDMKRSAAYTELENGYMVRYLERNDPELLLGITKMMQRNVAADTTRIQFATNVTDNQSGDGPTERMPRHNADSGDNTSVVSAVMSFSSTISTRTTTTSVALGLHQGVNFTMKIELVNKDYAVFAGDIERLRQTTKEELRDYTAQVEELRLSQAEAIDTLAEFRDFVMVKGRPLDNKPTPAKAATTAQRESVPLERFLKFIDKWVIHGNGMVEQMRLRTATLEQETREQEKSLAIKAELSGILLPVDFEQMEIEHISFEQSYADKESHLLGLKRVAGNVSLVLAKQRRLVEQSKAKLAAVKRRTAEVKADVAKFERSRENVEDDIEHWQERVDRLTERRSMYVAPSTMQYMDVTRRLHALEREVRMLRRQEQIVVAKDKAGEAKLRRWRAASQQRRRQHHSVLEEVARATEEEVETAQPGRSSEVNRASRLQRMSRAMPIRLEDTLSVTSAPTEGRK